MKNFYEVLGLQENANNDDIKKSYRKLAMQYHPDRNPNDKVAEQKFKEVTEAYETLVDEEKRKQYDYMRKGGGGFGGFGFEDLFNNFGRRSNVDLGVNSEQILECTFEETIRGASKKIRTKTNAACRTCNGSGCKVGHDKVTCKTCNGKGRVVVRHSPAPGVIMQSEKVCESCAGKGRYVESTNKCDKCEDGLIESEIDITFDLPARAVYNNKVSIKGYGLHRNAKGPKGDLILHLVPIPHQMYKFCRENKSMHQYDMHGYNIFTEVYITLREAIIGTQIEVPLLEKTYIINVPRNVSYDYVVNVPRAGLYMPDGNRSDIFIRVLVDMNDSLQNLELLKILETIDSKTANTKTSASRQRLTQNVERIRNG